ncbi:hypothetical protein [Novosphingobium malaysiense]|uniref:hypothetical protein n=1 Tax=Novosphingobium malaysiense TaxID=1348853 RepID=UPI00068B4930|nr:hypothetical protein [Novosphingobium malaysiense]
MAQSNFHSALVGNETEGGAFGSDDEALAWANEQVDRLAQSMRYSLERQIKGLPSDDRDLNAYEAVRHLLRNVSMGHASYMEADFLNPELTRMSATARIQFQLPSVDCMYHTALLHGDYSYRLKGNRGTAMIFQVTTYRGNAAELVDWKTWCVANNFDTDHLAPGRDIDVVFSRTKPENLGDAFWMEIPEGICELHLRQYYGDWDKEEPADLRIVREDQQFPAPILSRDLAQQRFGRLLNFLRVHADFCRAGIDAHLAADAEEVPELIVPGAFEGTQYFNGHFRCAPDEAVIIEARDPGALYWNMELVNQQWEPGDFWTRLSSYNMTQVHADADGVIRLVASWQDPGVPNWLDCSGRILSLFSFRFFKAREAVISPRLRTVPFADLENHMPASPKVTPQERHALLQRRCQSFYRRRFSDF